MKKYFIVVAKTTLILVYIVIVAGALVRMTGSGMGCPDWPKCFGYYIPPTDIKELIWAPQRVYEDGQVIIKDEGLLVAQGDFTSGDTFEPARWRPYTKHDYAIFNPTHTWIEYLNRLVGALAGVGTLVMAVLSFAYRRTNLKITLLSWACVVLMGFQGWLGATVVYSVLNPLKITLHMLVALLIVMVLLYIIFKVREKLVVIAENQTLRWLLFLALALSLIQIVMGTQVRQFVDEQVKHGDGDMGAVFDQPTIIFYIHRSFSILVIVVNIYIYYKIRDVGISLTKAAWIVGLIIVEIISGIIMYYFDFPFGFQTIHLILAAMLFGLQFYLYLEFWETKTSIE